MAASERRRADLDLQISLLAEHEITKLATVIIEVGRKLGVSVQESQLKEVVQDIAPEQVLDEIEKHE